MGSFIYLASPYSHPDPAVKQDRYEEICRTAAMLMEKGERVFCPIAHSHPIEILGMKTVHTGDFWLDQDFAILKHAEMLMVCMMPGWTTSHGIHEEIKFANENNIPVAYIEPPCHISKNSTEEKHNKHP
jgi:hypothetical protein